MHRPAHRGPPRARNIKSLRSGRTPTAADFSCPSTRHLGPKARDGYGARRKGLRPWHLTPPGVTRRTALRRERSSAKELKIDHSHSPVGSMRGVEYLSTSFRLLVHGGVSSLRLSSVTGPLALGCERAFTACLRAKGGGAKAPARTSAHAWSSVVTPTCARRSAPPLFYLLSRSRSDRRRRR